MRGFGVRHVLHPSKHVSLMIPRTGMQCLPASAVPEANGCTLHDWHAEVLAIRAFNRYRFLTIALLAVIDRCSFLIQECLALASSRPSQFVRRRDDNELSQECFQPFSIKNDIQIHIYCSEAPCN